MSQKRHFTTEQTMLCALFIALIAVGSYIRIPIPIVPFTLQLLCVMLAAHLLRPLMAGICILLYVLLGLLGIPVFAGGGGISYVLQPTFGYLIGFFFGAMLISSLVHRKRFCTFGALFLANLAGYAVVYCFGLGYYFCLNLFYFETYVELWPMVLSCLLVFLPSDLAFCFVSALISKRLRPVLER